MPESTIEPDDDPEEDEEEEDDVVEPELEDSPLEDDPDEEPGGVVVAVADGAGPKMSVALEPPHAPWTIADIIVRAPSPNARFIGFIGFTVFRRAS